MAMTVTLGVSTASTNNASSYASGSFTPTAGEFLLVFAVKSSETTAGGITDTGQGANWTFFDSFKWGGGGSLVEVFTCDAAALNALTTVTYSWTGGTGATGCVLIVYRIAGVPAGSGVRSSGSQTGTSGITPQVALNNTTLTGNACLALLCNTTNPAGVTAPTSWTRDSDTGYLTPTIGVDAYHINSGFTQNSVTTGGNSATGWGMYALEIGNVTVQTGSAPTAFTLPYHPANDPSLNFNGYLYIPNPAKWGNGPFPAIVCTRAGGFTDGGPGESDDMLHRLSGDAAGGYNGYGFVCLFADVRLVKHGINGGLPGQTSLGIYPQQTDDLAMAITYMRSHYLCNGFVALMGGSGSGCHAAYMALTGTPFKTRPDAAVVLSGQLDASDRQTDVQQNFIVTVQNYYNTTDLPTLKAVSPVGKVDASHPQIPFYFANGTAEPMPYSVATNFKAALDSAGVNYTFHINTQDSSSRHSFGTFPENEALIASFLKSAAAQTGGTSGGAPMGKSISSGMLPSISERMSKRGNIVGPQTYNPIMSSKSRAQYAQLKAKTARGEELSDSEIELWNVLSGIYG